MEQVSQVTRALFIPAPTSFLIIPAHLSLSLAFSFSLTFLLFLPPAHLLHSLCSVAFFVSHTFFPFSLPGSLSVSHSCFLLLTHCFSFYPCPSCSDEYSRLPHPIHPIDAFSGVAGRSYSLCKVREKFGLWRGLRWSAPAPNITHTHKISSIDLKKNIKRDRMGIRF